jgi:hypothetical protein
MDAWFIPLTIPLWVAAGCFLMVPVIQFYVRNDALRQSLGPEAIEKLYPLSQSWIFAKGLPFLWLYIVASQLTKQFRGWPLPGNGWILGIAMAGFLVKFWYQFVRSVWIVFRHDEVRGPEAIKYAGRCAISSGLKATLLLLAAGVLWVAAHGH